MQCNIILHVTRHFVQWQSTKCALKPKTNIPCKEEFDSLGLAHLGTMGILAFCPNIYSLAYQQRKRYF